jgi:glycerol-3-phosphate dehydrogenase
MDARKNACLEALKLFVEESSNENKMELLIVYDDIEDAEKEEVLGQPLAEALHQILFDNEHPDEYLEELQKTFFS